MNEIKKYLKQTEIFNNLTDEELSLLEKICKEKNMKEIKLF
jgi:signal-transduction protein with cAMP-binding, CBS, and nucleotidyltransferase domain